MKSKTMIAVAAVIAGHWLTICVNCFQPTKQYVKVD